MPDKKNEDSRNQQKLKFKYGNWSPWKIFLLITIIFIIPWVVNFITGLGKMNRISYSTFMEELEKGNIKTISIKGDEISGKLASPSGGEKGVMYFKTYIPSLIDKDTLTMLRKNEVRIETQPSGGISFFSILLNMLPFLIMIYIFYRLSKSMRERGQDIFQIGKSKAKRFQRSKTNITFNDVAGLDIVIEELKEVVDFLRNPDKYLRLGAKTPKGVLLIGPPGTGKTLIARAVASEALVPFFSISGSDFVEMFVGVGASRVRDLFKEAKKNSPSIIFIDELDSIGRRRGTGLGGGHDEREQTLNQLLSEIDGFERDEKTIVIAATNRPDVLDPALLRPGRFDRRITVNLPTKKDRVGILKIHARNKPMSEDIDIEKIARNTPGFSGADLENLLNEAALIAARRDSHTINQSDIDGAKDKIILGLERKNLILNDDERKTVAYHEAGHAIVAEMLPNTEPVHKVSIIPREFSMGVTQQTHDEDKYLYNKKYITDRIAVLLGGRASEQIKLKTMTSGAENDLKEAQKLVRKMVLDWGMGDRFKNISFGDQRQQVFLGEEIARRRNFSEETNREVDKEIMEILNKCFTMAIDILRAHEEELDIIAHELLDNEEIDGSDIAAIIKKEAVA